MAVNLFNTPDGEFDSHHFLREVCAALVSGEQQPLAERERFQLSDRLSQLALERAPGSCVPTPDRAAIDEEVPARDLEIKVLAKEIFKRAGVSPAEAFAHAEGFFAFQDGREDQAAAAARAQAKRQGGVA